MNLLHVIHLGEDAYGGARQVKRWIDSDRTGSIHHALLSSDAKFKGPVWGPLTDDIPAQNWKYLDAVNVLPLKIPPPLRSTLLRRSPVVESMDAYLSYGFLDKREQLKRLLDRNSQHRFFYDMGQSWDYEPTPYRQQFLQECDLVLAISSACAYRLREKYGVPDDKIVRFPSALPREHLLSSPAAKSPVTDTDVDDGENPLFSILYLGRLSPYKGVNILIRSMQYLPGNVRLHIVGEGSERNRLESLAVEVDVADKTTFHGYAENPTRFLRRAELLVSPSVREPSGNVNLEAGSVRVPVVSANVGGIPDYVQHNHSGLLLEPTIPPRRFEDDFTRDNFPDEVVRRNPLRFESPGFIDPEDLAAAVNSLRDNPSRRERLARNLHRHVKENFVMERVGRQIEQKLGAVTS